MRRLCVLLLVAAHLYAALPGTTTFEVRTTGSDTNGGGFDTNGTGSNMSLFANMNASGCTGCFSASANLSTTDAVSTNTTTITSATAAFTSAITGNIVQFSGGTPTVTTQWRRVAFVSSTSISVDIALGTSATGITMHIGGAFVTPGQASVLATNGNIVFIQNVGADGASVFAVAASLNSTTETFFQGYTSSRTLFNSDARPTLQAQAAALTMVTNATPIYEGLVFDGNSGGGFTTRLTSAGIFVASKFINMSNSTSGTDVFIQDEATSNSVTVIVCGVCMYNEAHANTTTAAGITAINNNAVVFRNLSYGNGGNGYTISTVAFVFGNSAYSNVGICFAATSGSATVLMNNYAEGCSTFGFSVSNNGKVFVNNAYYNNGTDVSLANTVASVGNIGPLSSSAFVNAAGGNFAINNTSGAGHSLRAAGYPTNFPVGTTANFADIGAAQHQDSGGGGGICSSPLVGMLHELQRPVPVVLNSIVEGCSAQ